MTRRVDARPRFAHGVPSAGAFAALVATASLALVAGCASRGGVGTLTSPPAHVEVQLLAFNDLHGTLEPPPGGGGRVGNVPAGGMAYVASHLARLEADNALTVVVSAGDNIGASSLVSSLFHDEPTIDALNAVGLDFSAVGNHELDEGWAELARMQRGGCHPRDGCQDGTPFRGASFQYLTANVLVDPARVDPAALASSGWKGATEGATLFPPYGVREFGGVKVGFVGLTLRGVPSLVGQSMVRGLTFAPEAAAANVVVDALVQQGVRAIVVLIHEGGRFTEGIPEPCAGLTGEIVGIVGALSPEVDVVVSGHTHRDYTCTMGSTLVTSAGSFGRMITDIDLSIDRRSGQVVSKRARNVVVTRDVPPNAEQAAIISRYAGLSAVRIQRAVGSIAAPISRDAETSGESPLGRVLADAFLVATSRPEAGNAVVAFINAGGIRSDLTTAGGDRTLTFGDVHRVMPFGNQWLVKTLTGEALIRLLEEQFDNPRLGEDVILQVSQGFTYTYRRSQPKGQRVERTSVRLSGEPVDPGALYRVAMPDFLWNGGDGFTVVSEGVDAAGAGLDLDLFAAYAGTHQPLNAQTAPRITRLP